MSPELIGLLGVAMLLLLMFINVPVAVSMALVGIVGYIIIAGFQPALYTAGLAPYSNTASYIFIVLPIFLLMGEFADIGQITKDSFRTANTWLGGLPGGLAMASVAGAAFFSTLSGSSLSCAATMTRIALPSLLDDYKYDPKLALGSLLAGGTLGNLIPPGNAFIFYAVMSDTSIGRLFIAAIIPGILLTIMYLVQIYIQCKVKPSLAPKRSVTTWKQKLISLKDLWALVFIFALVMGGIWFGIFTVTEAASVGTIATFIFAVIRKRLNGQNLRQAFNNTLRTTGMAIAIITGAIIFTYFISVSNLTSALADWVIDLQVAPVVVVIVMMLVYFVLGMVMDTLAMLFLTLPIFVGLIASLNLDLYWFGILVITQMELSTITPPVGMNIFVVFSLVKDRNIKMSTMFAAVIPFCGTMLIFNTLLIIFPQISLFLVHLMR
jgi:C4-dicarboxylate transporter, DctM subunit